MEMLGKLLEKSEICANRSMGNNKLGTPGASSGSGGDLLAFWRAFLTTLLKSALLNHRVY